MVSSPAHSGPRVLPVLHLHHAHRLAVVEDDPGLLNDLVEFLQLRGFTAHGFGSAETFFEAWPATRFDLLLLDVALPGASGLEIVQRVRAQDRAESGVGIVMLTALDANDDHALGLDAGADIFLSKRSSLEVIEAACRSVLRRLGLPDKDRMAVTGSADGTWRLNAPRWRLQAPTGVWLDLTRAEAVLLGALFEHSGRPITREELLERLGKRETLPGLRNLDNTASRLRRKVQAACGLELPLRPCYGRGYTFSGLCEVQT